MKKLISGVLALVIVLSLAGCSKPDNSGSSNSISSNDVSAEKTSSDDIKFDSKDVIPPMATSASIEPTMLLDQSGVKVTATSIEYTNYSVDVNVHIINENDEEVTLSSNTLAYSENSINGYMIQDGYLYNTVAAKSEADDKLSFGFYDLQLMGVNEISDISIGFYLKLGDSQAEGYRTYLKSSIFDNHDYSMDNCSTTILSNAAENSYKYTLLYSKNADLRDSANSVLENVFLIDKEGQKIFIIEYLNDSDVSFTTAIYDFAVNDTKDDGLKTSMTISSKKRGVFFIRMDDVENVTTVSFTAKQKDFDLNNLSISDIEIPISY